MPLEIVKREVSCMSGYQDQLRGIACSVSLAQELHDKLFHCLSNRAQLVFHIDDKSQKNNLCFAMDMKHWVI